MASDLLTKYRVRSSPTAMQGVNGTAWSEAHGAIEDLAIDDAIQAVKCQMPSLCPADALPYIGGERGIERGQSESDAVYGARLVDAWETWQRAGTPLAILLALESQGYTATAGDPTIVVQVGRAYSLDPDDTLDPPDRLIITTLGLNPAIGGTRPLAAGTHPWWNFDTDIDANGEQFNNRFALVFQDPLPAAWTAIAAPPTSGSAPAIPEVNRIRRMVTQWKGAGDVFLKIYVIGSGQLWGFPVADWGDPGLVWGGTSYVWNPGEQ